MAINKVVFGESTLIDLTGTTATASDVANGKVFYAADGTLTTGTSSGGGGTSANLIAGALRPDAELIETFSYDKYIHADEGINIPAYSTTAVQFKPAANLSPVVSVNFSNYDYLVAERFLVIPEYNISTQGKGRCEYWEGTILYEIVSFPAGFFRSLSQPGVVLNTASQMYYSSSIYREVYYSSASAITSAGVSYGVYEAPSAPNTSSTTITARSPALNIRGNASYLSEIYFNAITDIRFQWKIEVWRSPIGNLNIDGFGLKTSFAKAHEAAESSSHKLS